MFEPFKIIGLAISGKLNSPQLKRDFQLYLVLQILNLFLAVVSAFLGFARARVIFSGTFDPDLLGWIFAGFWAGMAFLLLAHITDRLAFRAQGGEFGPGEGRGFIVIVLVFLVFGGLDVYMNLQGVTPASYELTRDAYQAETGSIASRYQSQIEEHEAAIAAVMNKYTWKGVTYFRPTKYRPRPEWEADKAKVDQHEASIARLRDLRDQETAAELTTASNDATRYQQEVEMKQDGFTWFTYLMYVLMFFAGFRASLYSQLVLDYFEKGAYGDIPGTQEDRFGRRQARKKSTESEQKSTGNSSDEVQRLEAQIAALQARLDERAPVGYPHPNRDHSGNNRPNFPGTTRKTTGSEPVAEAGKKTTVIDRFYRVPPPNNTGKNYDTTPKEKKKTKILTATYERILNTTGERPTQSTLAQSLGWSEKTVRKYLTLAGLRHPNEQGTDEQERNTIT